MELVGLGDSTGTIDGDAGVRRCSLSASKWWSLDEEDIKVTSSVRVPRRGPFFSGSRGSIAKKLSSITPGREADASNVVLMLNLKVFVARA